jgi:hypothetical protein
LSELLPDGSKLDYLNKQINKKIHNYDKSKKKSQRKAKNDPWRINHYKNVVNPDGKTKKYNHHSGMK